jgi:FHA domain-containing protein
MSVLRNLEAKLGGLVEGAFSRAFKSSVQPVELAHKLAKEMEESQVVSVSRVYVPNHYRIFLSPDDREQFSSARHEGLALTSRPQIEFMTDDRLQLGEFGIQAQLLSPPEEEEPEAGDEAPSAGDFGHTMVYSPDREVRRLDAEPSSGYRALLVGEGRRTVLSGDRVLLGRSRECDVQLADPNVSRRHAELRRDDGGWSVVDLGSTNGIKLNGRRVDQAALEPGDRITLGLTELTYELD